MKHIVMYTILLVMCTLFAVKSFAAERVAEPFVYPAIPDTITDPSSRADFLVMNFWNNFKIEDKIYLNSPGIVEQAFTDYINLFGLVPRETVLTSIEKLLIRADIDKHILQLYVRLAEKYFFSPDAPYSSGEAYLPFVEKILAAKGVDKEERARYRSQHKILTSNNPGMVADDFEYVTSEGKKGKLKKLNTDFILLFFSDPDCADCSLMKVRLDVSPGVQKMIESGKLTVVSLYPYGNKEPWITKAKGYPENWINASIKEDTSFDLKRLPVLYLLDGSKKIILKHPKLEEVENALLQE